MRRVTVRVLPAPAPAMMRTGPSNAVTADICASSSPSRIVSLDALISSIVAHARPMRCQHSGQTVIFREY